MENMLLRRKRKIYDSPYKSVYGRIGLFQNSYYEDVWTPSQLSTSLWLDASDASTITEDVGVERWADKSGNGNDATQTTDASQPSYVSGEYVDFDGTDDFVTLGTALGRPASFSIFTVMKTDDITTTATICSQCNAISDSATKWGNIVINKTTNGDLGFYIGDDSDFSLYTSTSYRLNNSDTYIIGTTRESNADTEIVYANGASIDLTAIRSVDIGNGEDLYTYAIGRRGAANASYFNGRISEVIIMPSTISTTDRQKLEGYLAWKWDLVANLPVGHPYKTDGSLFGY